MGDGWAMKFLGDERAGDGQAGDGWAGDERWAGDGRWVVGWRWAGDGFLGACTIRWRYHV